MKLEEVQVNEILGFLDTYSPESLSDLKKEFPDYGREIEAGFIAGATDSKNKLKIKIAVASLKHIIKLCEKQLPQLTHQLTFGRKLRFTAELLAIVGGASIWGVLRTSNFFLAEVLAGLLTLFGAILILVSRYYSTNIEDEQILEVRSKLIIFKVEAQTLLDELNIFKNAATEREFELIAPSIARANKLFRDARESLETTNTVS